MIASMIKQFEVFIIDFALIPTNFSWSAAKLSSLAGSLKSEALKGEVRESMKCDDNIIKLIIKMLPYTMLLQLNHSQNVFLFYYLNQWFISWLYNVNSKLNVTS